MDNQTYLLLFCIFPLIGGGDCAMRSRNWEKDLDHLWYTTTDDVIYTTTDNRASVIFCASLCLENTECLVYGYNHITSTCRGFRSLKYSPVAILDRSEVIYQHKERCRRAGYDLLEDGLLCVKKHHDPLAWDDAQAQCEIDHGRLVVVDNYQKLESFVRYSGIFYEENILARVIWLGITDRAMEGSWVWINGAKLNTTYWQSYLFNNYSFHYKPNQYSADCGSVAERHIQDDSCFMSRPYICERVDLI